MDAESSPQALARLARLAGLATPGARLARRAQPLRRRHALPVRPGRRAPALPRPNLRRTPDARRRRPRGATAVLGPAHTPGDTIATCPTSDVVFARRPRVRWRSPSCGTAPPSVARALQTMLDLDATSTSRATATSPGRPAVEAMQRFWTWLRGGAADSATRPARTRSPPPRRSSDPRASTSFATGSVPSACSISVAALNRELAGQPPMRVTPAVRARLFRQVAILKRRLEDR